MKNNVKLFLLITLLRNYSLQATNNYQTRIAMLQKQEQLRFNMQYLGNEHNFTVINTTKKEMRTRKKIIEKFQSQGIALHIPKTTMTIRTQTPDRKYYVTSDIYIPAFITSKV
jgi:hypothetical protein